LHLAFIFTPEAWTREGGRRSERKPASGGLVAPQNRPFAKAGVMPRWWIRGPGKKTALWGAVSNPSRVGFLAWYSHPAMMNETEPLLVDLMSLKGSAL